MKVSEKGISFITEFEGFYPSAYKCQAGVWTIGIGTVQYPDGSKVKKGDVCTKQQAENWLSFELGEKCAYFNQTIERLRLVFNQDQYDALASFFYNVGIGKCKVGTTMGNAIYSKSMAKIANAFLVYNKYTWFKIKRVSKGLDRRRKAEKELFEGRA